MVSKQSNRYWPSARRLLWAGGCISLISAVSACSAAPPTDSGLEKNWTTPVATALNASIAEEANELNPAPSTSPTASPDASRASMLEISGNGALVTEPTHLNACLDAVFEWEVYGDESYIVAYLYEANGLFSQMLLNHFAPTKGRRIIENIKTGDYFLDIGYDGHWSLSFECQDYLPLALRNAPTQIPTRTVLSQSDPVTKNYELAVWIEGASQACIELAKLAQTGKIPANHLQVTLFSFSRMLEWPIEEYQNSTPGPLFVAGWDPLGGYLERLLAVLGQWFLDETDASGAVEECLNISSGITKIIDKIDVELSQNYGARGEELVKTRPQKIDAAWGMTQTLLQEPAIGE